MSNPSVSERFWAKVNKTEGCWEWTAVCKSDGYGVFTLRHGKKVLAHRYAFEDHIQGSIPDGMTIDHLCRNPRCVNPAHMEVVTVKENILRSDGLTAQNARKTHCDRGHEFTEENTQRNTHGRRCAQCKRDADARYRAKRGAKA